MPRITQAQYEEQKQKTAAVEADRDAWKSKLEELEKVFEPRLKEGVQKCMAHHEELVKQLSEDIGKRDGRIAQLEADLSAARTETEVQVAMLTDAMESRVANVSERAEQVLQTTILALMGAFFLINSIVWSLRCNDPNEL